MRDLKARSREREHEETREVEVTGRITTAAVFFQSTLTTNGFEFELLQQPFQNLFLVSQCGSPDLGKKLQTIRLDRRGILQALVTVAAYSTQIGGHILAAFRFIDDMSNGQTNRAI